MIAAIRTTAQALSASFINLTRAQPTSLKYIKPGDVYASAPAHSLHQSWFKQEFAMHGVRPFDSDKAVMCDINSFRAAHHLLSIGSLTPPTPSLEFNTQAMRPTPLIIPHAPTPTPTPPASPAASVHFNVVHNAAYVDDGGSVPFGPIRPDRSQERYVWDNPAFAPDTPAPTTPEPVECVAGVSPEPPLTVVAPVVAVGAVTEEYTTPSVSRRSDVWRPVATSQYKDAATTSSAPGELCSSTSTSQKAYKAGRLTAQEKAERAAERRAARDATTQAEREEELLITRLALTVAEERRSDRVLAVKHNARTLSVRCGR